MPQFAHLNDADNEKVSRLFNQLLTGAYQLPREDLEATTIVPMQNGLNPYIKSFTYKKVKEMGMAKLVADAALDLPPVSRGIELKTIPIHTGGDSWHLSDPEVNAWMQAGENIDTDERDTARRKVDELVDDVILHGDSARSIEGFVNSSNVPTVTLSTGASGKLAWSSKTCSEIVADIQKAFDAIRANTSKTSKPDSIAIAHAAYCYVKTAKLGTDSGKDTVLDYLKSAFPEIKNWYECSSLDGAGAADTDRFILYKKDPSCVAYAVPVLFKQMQPQFKGLCYTVNCYCRIAGAFWKRPTTAVYADGI